jgi:hypothetical protein
VTIPPPTGPYLAATALLGLAGITKAWRPADTLNALRVARFPVSQAAVRVGAVAELAVAVAALAVPGPVTGGLVAAAYAVFAVFIVVALRRGWPLASCGCFGRPDTPPTVAHAVLDVGAAAAAVWWAAAWRGDSGFSRWGRLFFHQPWHGGALALLTVVLAGLAYTVWTNPLPAEGR